MTLDQALARYWLDHAHRTASAKTTQYQAASLRRIVGKDQLLSSLDVEKADRFVSKRRGEVSDSTVNKELSLLARVMRRAAKRWNAKVAEIEWSELRLEEPDHRTRYLTPDEAERLLSVAAPHLRPVIVCALCTGLRRSNVMQLDWSNVDMQARTITVRIKSKKPGGKVLTVPIAQPLFVELAKLGPKDAGPVFLYEPPKRRAGSKYDNPERKEFKRRPAPRPVAKMNTAWERALRAAKIKDFRWHDLRHTCATWMRQSGVDILTVKAILGHTDIRSTMRYAHAADDAGREAVAAVGDALSGIGSAGTKRGSGVTRV